MFNKLENTVGFVNIHISRRYLQLKNLFNSSLNYSRVNIFLSFINSYLNSTQEYSSVSLHRVFISDKLRNKTYLKAIKKANLKDKIVLDAGCGIGLMSIFAAKEGAKKIIAVDRSNIIDLAKKVIKSNRLNSKIEVLQQDLLKINLKTKVDAIIHDTIGHFLINENSIETIKKLRNKFLSKNGIIIPSKVDWYFVPINLSHTSNNYYPASIWQSNTFGINFKDVLPYDNFKPVVIFQEDKKNFMAAPFKAFSLDYYSTDQIPKTINLFFIAEKKGFINGLMSFFKINLFKNIYLSTAPSKTNTHKGQAFYPFKKTIAVNKGDFIQVRMSLNSLNAHQWKIDLITK